MLLASLPDAAESNWLQRRGERRRQPYTLVGGFLLSLSFIAICILPCGLSTVGHFIYRIIAALLYFTFYTVTRIPFGALAQNSVKQRLVKSCDGYCRKASYIFLTERLDSGKLFTNLIVGRQLSRN